MNTEAWTRMGSDNLLSVGMTRRVVNANWSGWARTKSRNRAHSIVKPFSFRIPESNSIFPSSFM